MALLGQQTVMSGQPLLAASQPCTVARLGAANRLATTTTRAPRAVVRLPRRSVQVYAGATAPGPQDEPSTSDSASSLLSLQAIQDGCDLFMRRYDVLSPGIGALLVTGFCVSRGQDPFTALSITFCSTILALVLNELMFNNDNQNQW